MGIITIYSIWINRKANLELSATTKTALDCMEMNSRCLLAMKASETVHTGLGPAILKSSIPQNSGTTISKPPSSGVSVKAGRQ